MADLALVQSARELDDLCSRLSYTTDQLAAELNVSRATVFNWKKDERGLPRLVSLALFALEHNPVLRRMDTTTEKRRKDYKRSSMNVLEKGAK